MQKIAIPDPQAMETLGSAFSKAMQNKGEKLWVYLVGPLGAGKTTFVRGFLRGFNFNGIVKSPTYTLVEPYDIAIGAFEKKLYHFDFYRLADPQELEWMGIRDYFQGDEICFIEWPEKAEGYIPKPDITIFFEISQDKRLITLKMENSRGKDVVQALNL